jgi:hypothetical protein
MTTLLIAVVVMIAQGGLLLRKELKRQARVRSIQEIL